MISILYVDDESSLLEITKMFIERAGDVTVDTSSSAKDAIRKMEQARYDAVVSDYQMPDMDGLELLKYLRRTYGKLPFILFTGKGREEIAIEALNNGADFYLQKGGEPKAQFAELRNKIYQAVQRRRAEDELKQSHEELKAAYTRLTAIEEELRQNYDKLDKSQSDLRESEERLRTMIEQSPLSIQVLSPDGRTLQINHAFEETWAITLGDLKNYNILTDEQLIRIGLMPYIKRGFSGEAVKIPPTHYDAGNTLGFGKKIWVRGYIYPIRDASGAIRNVIVMHEDITELKKAEDALLESEERFRLLFKHMLNGFALCRMIYDGDKPTDFTYLLVNDAFAQLTGLKEVTGKKVSEVIPGVRETNPELFEIYGRVAATGIPERFETYIDVLKIWFSISVYSIERGTFVAVFDNISERKQVETELKHRNEELADLINRIRNGKSL